MYAVAKTWVSVIYNRLVPPMASIRDESRIAESSQSPAFTLENCD